MTTIHQKRWDPDLNQYKCSCRDNDCGLYTKEHSLGCNDYHQHRAPNCCAQWCWCQTKEEAAERTYDAEGKCNDNTCPCNSDKKDLSMQEIWKLEENHPPLIGPRRRHTEGRTDTIQDKELLREVAQFRGNKRHFIFRAEHLGYYCSSFRLESIVGECPVSPKIGDLADPNEIFNIIGNDCIITILPRAL
jgi:hypothetical protein